mmetsp:Transcript_1652/g.1755  ORF Transcript_1652/g.1755 Transcript_1652/m.1755 type:complete len:284 (-) Transcript_1652:148-999(-)
MGGKSTKIEWVQYGDKKFRINLTEEQEEMDRACKKVAKIFQNFISFIAKTAVDPKNGLNILDINAFSSFNLQSEISQIKNQLTHIIEQNDTSKYSNCFAKIDTSLTLLAEYVDDPSKNHKSFEDLFLLDNIALLEFLTYLEETTEKPTLKKVNYLMAICATVETALFAVDTLHPKFKDIERRYDTLKLTIEKVKSFLLQQWENLDEVFSKNTYHPAKPGFRGTSGTCQYYEWNDRIIYPFSVGKDFRKAVGEYIDKWKEDTLGPIRQYALSSSSQTTVQEVAA